MSFIKRFLRLIQFAIFVSVAAVPINAQVEDRFVGKLLPELKPDFVHVYQRVLTKLSQPAKVQFTKEAFLHDAEQDCYWCPAGQKLKYAGASDESKRRQFVGTNRTVFKVLFKPGFLAGAAFAVEICNRLFREFAR